MNTVVAVLFAFNQEKYVRHAVRDLFCQEIEEMDIILSDDASSDDTYNIIREEADNYTGSLNISIRRNKQNMGFNAHINEIIRTTSAEIIIPFSGDDRFHPHRARRLKQALECSGALLAHSDVWCIDNDGMNSDRIHKKATF